MRGPDHQQSARFSYLSPEQRVRKDHPLRDIRRMADQALQAMSSRFDALCAQTGRPSIAPEKLLRAQLLQMLYSVRSERLLMEEIDYSLLYRWFVGMNLDEPVWDVTVFTKNRDRLLDGDVAREFLGEVVRQAQEKGLTSDEHFTVDGTLVEAWAGLKSFQRKHQKNPPPEDPGNPTVDFHGETRRNETHESTTDADARLARKGNGQGGQVELQREPADGEPQWVDRDEGSLPDQRHRRARCRLSDDRADSGRRPGDGGRRQRLRHPRLRGGMPDDERDSSRGAEHQAERRQRHRPTDQATRRL
jgi:transposase